MPAAQPAFDPVAVRDSLAPFALDGERAQVSLTAQADYLAHYRLPVAGADLEHLLGTVDTAHHRIAVQHWRPATPSSSSPPRPRR